MEESNYVKSQPYEDFIRFAWPCERDEHGARNQYMANLMDKEAGGAHVSHLKYQDILGMVKTYMIDAVHAALKRDLSKDDKQVLESYEARIKKATASLQLLHICHEGKGILRKYMEGLQE